MVAALTESLDATARAVLDAIARAVLGDERDEPVTVGGVTLHPHQRDALRRVRASMAASGGALLADEPGLGKTYVALALAREYPHAIVVAPAALREMWREASNSADIRISFVSIETLSRRDVTIDPSAGLVIVDEAHQASNPSAARYKRLARLISSRHTLLMSATPVRNRRGELGALLALFMGPRAHALDESALARCMVRRVGDASLLPSIDGPHWHRARAVSRLRDMIVALPPPLPALDGREASVLLATTLARCWASSLAALDAALRRRLQRGAALETLLADGLLPTRDELRAWVVGDDGVQLAFSILAANRAPDASRLRDVLGLHLAAVRALRVRIRPLVGRDAAWRAAMLLGLRRAHPDTRIVAFTSHAATAEALYSALAGERGIALLTARGARTAGGPRPRADVIGALGGARIASERDDISLVLTTDLLSEGVNLQGASVIVHLDVPWTPAGLDQRVGRAARLGSSHACVHVHGIAPPYSAERLLSLERLLRMKHAERMAATGGPIAAERLRALVRPWLDVGGGEGEDTFVACVASTRGAFLAVVDTLEGRALVGGVRKGGRRWNISDAPGVLCDIAAGIEMRSIARDAHVESIARSALARWLADRRARATTGAGTAPSHARKVLLARIDAAVRAAGAHSRAALAGRVAGIRSLVSSAVSAGAECTLAELANLAYADLESLLVACETALAGARDRGERRDDAPPTVRALLVLRRTP